MKNCATQRANDRDAAHLDRSCRMDEARARPTQAAQEEQNMKHSGLIDVMANMLQAQAPHQHTQLVQVRQAQHNKAELST